MIVGFEVHIKKLISARLEKLINKNSNDLAAKSLRIEDQQDAEDYTQQIAKRTIETWQRRKKLLKINRVFFAFANRQIIKALSQRGALLKAAQFDKAD